MGMLPTAGTLNAQFLAKLYQPALKYIKMILPESTAYTNDQSIAYKRVRVICFHSGDFLTFFQCYFLVPFL